ncbi:Very-long-chain 3-oxoacyl-CoA reductase [Handroanthus impetiginosus]|uniref:Very-long-chain 3-oxoacyl-CoA reductase n=1 Tax=Handroanthus impetiginosus TaxID=429701 RepID=A0A2G9HJR1_9LAMI|nr:Very-long-chain 3-oxoacyl-CoA reductase [Handroanthus impetiginosus]
MQEMIEGLDIGVLINNVCVTYPGAMYFHEVDEKIWMNLLRVNVEGTSHVKKVVLKGMAARRRGAIINMSSGASIVVPSHPPWLDQLSRVLYVEYKQYEIDVQYQVSEKYVEAAVGFIGYDQPRCTPNWAHSIQWFFASLLPDARLDEWRLLIGIRRMKLTT